VDAMIDDFARGSEPNLFTESGTNGTQETN
jgi:hypothetical protein